MTGSRPDEDTALTLDSESKLREAVAALQEDLAAERDRRLQERFLWALGGTICLDAYLFAHMENWSGPIAILVLELVMLIVVGRMCGVEDISQLVTYLLRHAGDQVAGNKDKT